VSSSSFVRSAGSTSYPSVAISVEDQGIGVPEELRERVFEPFFTAWSSDSGRGGTGLGLAVVKSIVKDHGGTVSLSPGSGGAGSCFVVHFPVRQAQPFSNRKSM